MNNEKTKEELEWFDNPSIIANALIGIIIITILVSQSYMVTNNMNVMNILGSIMNHNGIYLFILFYLISIKTKTGKKLFNYLNITLIIIYMISFIAAFLTVFQSFGIIQLLNVAKLAMILVYLFHSLLKNTRWEKEFKLKNSPFNEITNDGYFIVIMTFAVTTLVIRLIDSLSLGVIMLSLFDAIYILLFIRFIYLYNEFINSKIIKKENAKTVKKQVKSNV